MYDWSKIITDLNNAGLSTRAITAILKQQGYCGPRGLEPSTIARLRQREGTSEPRFSVGSGLIWLWALHCGKLPANPKPKEFIQLYMPQHAQEVFPPESCLGTEE